MRFDQFHTQQCMDNTHVDPYTAAVYGSDEYGGIGMQLDIDSNGNFIVEDLVDGGPAHTSGKIKRRSRIISVNGTPVRGLTLEQVSKSLAGPVGTPVLLAFDSNSYVYTVEVVRARLRAGGSSGPRGPISEEAILSGLKALLQRRESNNLSPSDSPRSLSLRDTPSMPRVTAASLPPIPPSMPRATGRSMERHQEMSDYTPPQVATTATGTDKHGREYSHFLDKITKMYEQSMRLRQHEKVEERFNRVKHVHAKAEQHVEVIQEALCQARINKRSNHEIKALEEKAVDAKKQLESAQAALSEVQNKLHASQAAVDSAEATLHDSPAPTSGQRRLEQLVPNNGDLPSARKLDLLTPDKVDRKMGNTDRSSSFRGGADQQTPNKPYDYSGDLVVTVAPATSRGGRGGGLNGGEAESVNYKEWIEMLVLDRCVLEFSSPKSSHLLSLALLMQTPWCVCMCVCWQEHNCTEITRKQTPTMNM
jgi:hypothetical protein